MIRLVAVDLDGGLADIFQYVHHFLNLKILSDEG